MSFTLCHAAGCTAEAEADRDTVEWMKRAGGMMVYALNAGGTPIAFPVPLIGFDQAFAGPPMDNKQYTEARKALMAQIAQRAEELKKQQAGGQPAKKK